MYVLGVNSVYHESAACLLYGGRPIGLAEEERFTGERHAKTANPYGSWLLPFYAIKYCLETADITIDDIHHITYSFQPGRRFRRNLGWVFASLLTGNLEPFQREMGYWYFNRRVPYFLAKAPPRKQSIRKPFLIVGKPNWKFHFVEHHLAHAASGFFVSPFDEAAILSVDGIGETCCTLMAIGRGNRIKKLKEIDYPNSLGFFYEEVTTFLGFQRNHDEYKVMALAAYGKPCYYDALRKLVAVKPNGGYEVNIDFRRASLFGTSELHEVAGAPRFWGAPLTERHADIAASVQKVLEDTMLHILEWLHERTESENLCLAGGIALNCVLNERIREESPFKRVWVQPAAHDAGTALGAALLGWHSVLNQPRQEVVEHVYLGPQFSNAEIEAKLQTSKIPYRQFPHIAGQCARLIAQGKTVGWFQGRMEWGPRALGNRSILADPRDPTMKDKLNRIKGREEFRPFAPAILEEATSHYFECSEPSPFMLFARKVRPTKKCEIPAVVHVDGTARVQTVNKRQNPLFYQLIAEFGKITGVPMVVNTSLNYAGKPIVATIEQAIDCFYNTGLDYLTLGHFLISKKEVEPDEWLAVAKGREDLGISK